MNPELTWLENPEIFRVGRLDAHSDHVCYASREEISTGSSFRQSLDGLWKFWASEAPGNRPADFYREDFDDSSFGVITVPGHIQLQGHGQIHYTNTLYPWDGHAELRPPKIDWAHNLVGSYVRRFTLEPGLRNKKVRIRFEGVEQAIYVWLNGSFVGYSEDSFTPSEFDLTPFLRDGYNRLCAEVYQRSSAAWLEDQDFFRFSGIFRSVTLVAEPDCHLEDLWLKADLLPDCRTGTLQVRMLLRGAPATVLLSLQDENRELLRQQALELRPRDGYLESPLLTLPGVIPWNHENPHLYTAMLTLQDQGGKVSEVIPYRIGFRHFEMKDGIMELNGKRIVFHGVNRHEWNPAFGRAIGPQDMESAAEVFHRNNINSVRTSHYPNQSLWYDICDREGFYMIDETNLETHGTWQRGSIGIDPRWNVPGSLPEWKACVLDRANSMFQRDKNHTAILIWSLGNESYAGDDLEAMSDFFHKSDPSRLVHYEGVFHNRAYAHISDMESRMYATPEDCREYLESKPKKPMILCEYMHDMGNSIGGMESYIRLEEEFPMYQGGFIWDYMDQALWQTNPQGQKVLGYGGDFGDRQSDYAFSGNGIVFADGTEKPAMQDVRYWYSGAEARKIHDQQNRIALEKLTPAAFPIPTALTVTHGDGALGIRGDHFEILFSHLHGGPVSLRYRGREWLWRAPRPAFWRAPTENDLGCGFPQKSALWEAADFWPVCTGMESEESSDGISVRYTYTASSIPGLRTEILYFVSRNGFMEVTARYEGAPGRPELPLFGVRFETPVPLSEVSWLGLSGETYPDRKKGGFYGRHRQSPGLPHYLVPQECGGHEDTREVCLIYSGDEALTLTENRASFGFSAIPYTPRQLESADHEWELPLAARTVVTVYGAMRGIGGIDSWGTDVEKPFRISAAEDHTLTFRVIL